MSNLQILADANIPCVEAAFGEMGAIERRAGTDIGPDAVADVDVLLVRSVTPVGPALLEGSDVQFVGSATIGTDHVDRSYLADRGIAFAHAPGSNADSVADYVVAAALELAGRRQVSLQDRTVGVVGCGNVGGRVAHRFEALGASVLRNDPPRAEAAEARGASHAFVPLDDVLTSADILTVHVPLTSEGPYPTDRLMDAEVFSKMRPGTWFVNTSRGEVVQEAALLEALQTGPVAAAVLDVWRNEPTPIPALVRAATLATPHIAGYAYDGKVRGTRMLYQALCDELGIEPTWSADAILRPATPDALRCHPPDPRLPQMDWLRQLVRQVYDIRVDDAGMRRYLRRPPEERGAVFRALRAEYPRRRECQQHTLRPPAVPPAYVGAATEGVSLQLSA